jgi:DNA polymerase III subunit delta'
VSDPQDIPEPDRAEGAPHPRETARLFGQEVAEAAFLDTWCAGRMHHAWLISGAKGVGKATLAWKIARFLLAEAPLVAEAGLFGAEPPPATLDLAPDHPIVRRTTALSEGRLCLVRRGWDTEKKRLKSEITVDEARKLKTFLSLSAADGGRRVILVDAVDEMNTSAANALLKILEEPPSRTTLLLVSHQPARLLPTIRSRCRDLRCAMLAPGPLAQALAGAGVEVAGDPVALAELSGGAPGQALELVTLDGLATYAELVAILSSAPSLDRARAVRLTEGLRASDPRTPLLARLIEAALARLSAAGAGHPPAREAAPGEARMLARLAPSRGAALAWAELHQSLGARARHGLGVNLDPSALILDMLLTINETASRLGTPPRTS